jgi:hypothetical protein
MSDKFIYQNCFDVTGKYEVMEEKNTDRLTNKRGKGKGYRRKKGRR